MPGWCPVLNGLGDVAPPGPAPPAPPGSGCRPAACRYRHGAARPGCGGAGALAADPGRLAGLDLRYRDDPPGLCRRAGESPERRSRPPASPRSAPGCRPRRAAWPIPPACSSARPSPAIWAGRAARSTGSTHAGRPNPMRQAVTLDAPVLQVREIPAGATVGYGASWAADRPSRIATVAAGYADGYLRALSGGRSASSPGSPCPWLAGYPWTSPPST